ACGDIGAVAAVLQCNGTKARMIAKRLAGISAEAPARTLCGLLGNQRHGAVESDIEDLVARFQARIGLVMADEWPEAADAGGDRLAGLRMLADLARQRQQLQRKLQLDIGGRRALGNAGAPRLLAFRIILLLAELD